MRVAALLDTGSVRHLVNGVVAVAPANERFSRPSSRSTNESGSGQRQPSELGTGWMQARQC